MELLIVACHVYCLICSLCFLPCGLPWGHLSFYLHSVLTCLHRNLFLFIHRAKRHRSLTKDSSCHLKFMIGLLLFCLVSVRFISAFSLNFTFTFFPHYFLIFITLFCILEKLKIIVHINVSIFHNISSVLYCSRH